MKKNTFNNLFLFLSLLGILSSCSEVQHRIEDAKAIPTGTLTGVAAAENDDKMMSELLLVWEDEQQRVQRASLHKMALLPWIKARIEEAHDDYLRLKKIRNKDPQFTKEDLNTLKLNEAKFNQAALSVADKVISSKEYRARFKDSLYYLLGTTATEEGIAVAQIGLNFDGLQYGGFENFVTTSTTTLPNGNEIISINTEKRQTSGLNLYDDLMNRIDSGASYSAMQARGITDTEITALSAFVRFFSENENINLPLIGEGNSERGFKRKIYTALWAALRSATLPMSPDGVLLTPPNGIKIAALPSQECVNGSPTRTARGPVYYLCELIAVSQNNELLGQDLRIKTFTGPESIGGESRHQEQLNEYIKFRFGPTASMANSPAIRFDANYDPVSKAADFAPSDAQVIRNFVKTLTNDVTDIGKAALISGARGALIGNALGEVMPGFTAAEGRGLGGATNIIATFYNAFLKKERLTEQQIANVVNVITALTAQVDNDGVLINKTGAMWAVFPDQANLAENGVQAGVRLVRRDATGNIVKADVRGAELMKTYTVKVALPGMSAATPEGLANQFSVQDGSATVSQDQLIGKPSTPQASLRYGNYVKDVQKLARMNRWIDKFEGKSRKEIAETFASEQVRLNFPSNNVAFKKYSLKLMNAFFDVGFMNKLDGQSWDKKMEEIFEEEFGIPFNSVVNANSLEKELNLAQVAEKSDSFRGSEVGLAVYLDSLRKGVEKKDEILDFAQDVYDYLSENKNIKKVEKIKTRF